MERKAVRTHRSIFQPGHHAGGKKNAEKQKQFLRKNQERVGRRVLRGSTERTEQNIQYYVKKEYRKNIDCEAEANAHLLIGSGNGDCGRSRILHGMRTLLLSARLLEIPVLKHYPESFAQQRGLTQAANARQMMRRPRECGEILAPGVRPQNEDFRASKFG